jgi:L-alanine-DL-glutamate epimerase-like enolase superfamily enzyme
MQISAVDIFVYKFDQHYRLSGSEHVPGLIAGTDYYFEPHWRQAYSRRVESCLIRVTTDSGLVGWGEAQAPILPETPGSVIRHLAGPFLIGQNPLARARIVDELYHMNHVRGHGSGFMVDAIAAVDLALWDLAGHHYAASVAELLGGPLRTELTAYVSGLRQPTLEQQCDAAREYMDQGFAGIKLFVGQEHRRAAEIIRSVRKAAGPDARLFCDFLWRYRVEEALRLSRVLEDEGYEWVEAPIEPEDVDGHCRLVNALDLAVAVGESMRTPYEFLPWLAKGALTVAQPDIGRTGLINGLKIASLCEAHRVPVAPHVGVCSGIAVAATWQFAAVLPNFLIQETQVELLANANRMLKSPLEVREGLVRVPDGPGLGIEVDETTVRDSATECWRVE